MRRILSIGTLFFIALAAPATGQEARLLRFPTIHGDRVVFSYAGNLYTVPAQGGIARRLTSHIGYEMFPRFSPDGKWIAFTGQYDGNTEVYLIPSEGGVPRRLTYTATLARDEISDRMGPNNIVMGWTPDGKSIVFRSRMREPNSFIGQLFLVPAKGGLPKQLPLPRGGFCSFSPDGKKLAYNRVFREFRTWKRYRGGMADEIWIHDFQSRKTIPITHNPAQDIIPMWAGNRVYFLSDRDKLGRMNLYVADLASKRIRRVTDFTDFDIKFPSLGPDAIVFEKGGWIYRFDLASEAVRKIAVRILEDKSEGRAELHSVAKEIQSYEIAPDGKRALFWARGDIFTVPASTGPTRNLTTSPGVHDRNPKWSPDGKWVAFISDRTGEDEIWIVPQDGSGPARQLTRNGDTYKYMLLWSPDSRKILWADKKMRLQFVDVATRKITPIDQAKYWEIRSYVWSPDSQWVAYVKANEAKLNQIWLYSLEQGKSRAATTAWYDSYAPAFSEDGKYLYFVSDRDFNPVFSRTEWNHAYLEMSRLYLVTLSTKTPTPFPYKTDEVAVEEKKTEKPDKGNGKAKKKEPLQAKAAVVVDFDGIADRVLRLKVPVGLSYGNLTSVGSSLYYTRRTRKDPKSTLCMFNLKARKETVLGPISGYEISANGKKMLVSRGGSYYIIDLPKGSLSLGKPLDLSEMEVVLDRRKEWRQIFHECWRQMRDFFYDPGMHGVDWQAMRRKYAPLVEHVNHRADLSYIIGEMIGELNAGHCYVGGGDLPKLKKVNQGLLGAGLSRDAKTGYYRIDKILKGVSWDPSLRSPLAELGMNVREGDYILAVDGKTTREMVNIFAALVNTAGRQVRLRINSKPTLKGSRVITVVPIADEQPLYYYNWVQKNIEYVDRKTNGRVGYLHIPDMISNGLNHFARHFYPQIRKKALIIDVRGNGGGNVSPQIIERLRRELAMMKVARNTAHWPDPFEAMYGPMVCLVNEFSASDGDLFPYRFKRYKLGKLIGKRTWGGVIGIRGSLPLLDGGMLRKPEFATYGRFGKQWIIENHGVEPDIYVDNDPALEYAGHDQQLDRAIAEVLAELRTRQPQLPPPPPYPKR